MGPIDLFPDTPRGEQLPIGKAYAFGQEGAEGFSTQWIQADDPEITEAGFKVAITYVDIPAEGERRIVFEPPTPDAKPVSYLYLRDPEGKLVATWDEGRWWTPEESAAFQLALMVPGVSAIDAYGLGSDTPKGGIEWPE